MGLKGAAVQPTVGLKVLFIISGFCALGLIFTFLGLFLSMIQLHLLQAADLKDVFQRHYVQSEDINGQNNGHGSDRDETYIDTNLATVRWRTAKQEMRHTSHAYQVVMFTSTLILASTFLAIFLDILDGSQLDHVMNITLIVSSTILLFLLTGPLVTERFYSVYVKLRETANLNALNEFRLLQFIRDEHIAFKVFGGRINFRLVIKALS